MKEIQERMRVGTGSACHLLLVHRHSRAPRRPSGPVTKRAHVDFQFAERSAQGISVHAKLPRGAALIALVFLEHGDDEAALEFAHCFRIENVAAIHLQYQCFQLVLHGISRFLGSMAVRAAASLPAHAPASGPGASNPVPGRTSGAIRRARPISRRAPLPGNKAPATTALTNANSE